MASHSSCSWNQKVSFNSPSSTNGRWYWKDKSNSRTISPCVQQLLPRQLVIYPPFCWIRLQQCHQRFPRMLPILCQLWFQSTLRRLQQSHPTHLTQTYERLFNPRGMGRFQADKKRRDKQYEVDDQVCLSTKYLSSRRPCRKLDYKRIGPFKIIEKIGSVAYKLELPPKYQVHNVFHVSLLSDFEQNPFPSRLEPPPPPEEIDGDEEFIVDSILDDKKIGRKQYYLVHWLGYPMSYATWEPLENLQHCTEKVREYCETKKDILTWTETRIPLLSPQSRRFGQGIVLRTPIYLYFRVRVFIQEINTQRPGLLSAIWIGRTGVMTPLTIEEYKTELEQIDGKCP